MAAAAVRAVRAGGERHRHGTVGRARHGLDQRGDRRRWLRVDSQRAAARAQPRSRAGRHLELLRLVFRHLPPHLRPRRQHVRREEGLEHAQAEGREQTRGDVDNVVELLAIGALAAPHLRRRRVLLGQPLRKAPEERVVLLSHKLCRLHSRRRGGPSRAQRDVNVLRLHRRGLSFGGCVRSTAGEDERNACTAHHPATAERQRRRHVPRRKAKAGQKRCVQTIYTPFLCDLVVSLRVQCTLYFGKFRVGARTEEDERLEPRFVGS